MTSARPMIALMDLGYSYGSGQPFVLQEISLQIAAGTVTALLGPNGSGKTTLLNIVLGWLVPSRGRVEILGNAKDTRSRKELSRLIGLVPQDEQMTFELSVAEYVLLGRAPYLALLEKPAEDDRRLALRALDSLGLSDVRERPITTLSGGERQLAVIARALVQEPQVLLLDEPMSHLDIANTQRILRVLMELRGKGKTIVFTTHDPNIAEVADMVVLLKKGRLQAAGAAASTLTSENLGATYGVRVEVVTINGRPVVLTRI